MRFIVDTYLPYDTGGPEALVQLALALHRVLNVQKRFPGHSAHVWRKKIASRNWHEYPQIAGVPTLHGELQESLGPSDVLFQPDVRGTDFCSLALTSRGVTIYSYVLSVNFLSLLAKSARHQPQHCRFLHHSFRLSNYTGWGGVASVPRSLIVRPYISPSIVGFCTARANRTRLAASRAPPALDASSASMLALSGMSDSVPAMALTASPAHASRPLVLLDNDNKGDVCFHASRSCNESRCEVVNVNRLKRSVVSALIARASVVVDWCMVGTERLPLEAVLCGAVLLSSDCPEGGARGARDFPMARRNLLSDPSELPGAIRRVLTNLDAERRGQMQLLELYDTGTSAATMEEEAAAAVETISRARQVAAAAGAAVR